MAKAVSVASILITQGNYKFYTLTLHSDVLARTCFVVNRFEDPKEGFQRYLDENRAAQIAEYIDSGLGTVPTSVVLSAQDDAEVEYDSKKKTLRFKDSPKAFLIIDGQHRVYGFSKAKSTLRVPVVIYTGLTREQETKLFIDINTKQKSVPNELLLDIRKQALYENDTEKILGELFDLFNTQQESVLLGLLSPSSRVSGKISRVTFNRAFNTVIDILTDTDRDQAFRVFNAYLSAFTNGMIAKKVGKDTITNPTIFATIVMFFPDVARRVQDKFEDKYTISNFSSVLGAFFENISTNTLKKPTVSRRQLLENFRKIFQSSFSLKL